MARALSILRRAVSLPERDQWPAEGPSLRARCRPRQGSHRQGAMALAAQVLYEFDKLHLDLAEHCLLLQRRARPVDHQRRSRNVVSSSQTVKNIELIRSC